jgi:hypothetical protein
MWSSVTTELREVVWLASTVFGLSIFGVGLSVALALASPPRVAPSMVAQTPVGTASHTLCEICKRG